MQLNKKTVQEKMLESAHCLTKAEVSISVILFRESSMSDRVTRKNVADRIIEWANAMASFCGARSNVPGRARDAPGLYLNHSIRHGIID